MANILTKRGSLDNIVTYQHICDTFADIQNIKQEEATLGSIALVITGKSGGLEVYIANSQHEWLLLTTVRNNSGSGSGDNEGVTLSQVNALIEAALGQNSKLPLIFSSSIQDTPTGVKINDSTYGILAPSADTYGTVYVVNTDGIYREYYTMIDSLGAYKWNEIGHELKNIRDGNGDYSIAEGAQTYANGQYSHAQGHNTHAQGDCSHTEGGDTTARGNFSHAEGYKTIATGHFSHAQGGQSRANATQSHAEGGGTVANGPSSHAQGVGSAAYGEAGHAQGYYTISRRTAQHVFGTFNEEDLNTSTLYGTYVEIVGNGTSGNRSNARTLDWSGNEWLAGTLTTSSNGIQLGSTAMTQSQLQTVLAGSIAPPTIDGTYTLQVTVTNGTPTYNWVSAGA